MKRYFSEENSPKYYKARKAAKAFANKAGGRSAASREKRLFKESDDTLTPNQLEWTDKVSFEMSNIYDEFHNLLRWSFAGEPYKSIFADFVEADWELETAETISDVKEAVDDFNTAIDELDQLYDEDGVYEDYAEQLRNCLLPIYSNILKLKRESVNRKSFLLETEIKQEAREELNDLQYEAVKDAVKELRGIAADLEDDGYDSDQIKLLKSYIKDLNKAATSSEVIKVVFKFDDLAESIAEDGLEDMAEAIGDALGYLRGTSFRESRNRRRLVARVPVREARRMRRALKQKESNDYLDKEDDPIVIIYNVYAALKAFGWGRRDYLDVLKDVVDSRGDYTADDIRDVADVLEDSGDYGEEAEALRYAADDLER